MIEKLDSFYEQKYKKKVLNREKVIEKSQFKLVYDFKSEMPIDGDFVEGSKVFMRNCSGCHTLDSNTQKKNSSGPALGSIVGRMAASDV
jgi:cytochrome c2